MISSNLSVLVMVISIRDDLALLPSPDDFTWDVRISKLGVIFLNIQQNGDLDIPVILHKPLEQRDSTVSMDLRMA